MLDQQELRRYIYMLLRWWWLIALCTLLGAGAAYYVSSTQAPTYRASTTLLVHQAPGGASSEYQALLTSERLAQTYAQMLTGRPVLGAVIDDLDLQISPADLADVISVELVRDTQLIRIAVDDHSPVRAARIANAVAAAFTAQNEALQRARYADSLANVLAQMDEIGASIDKTQAQLDALGSAEDTSAGTSAGASQRAAELARLETTLSSQRVTYASLVQTYETMRLTAAQTADDVVVYEPAEAPLHPTGPSTLRNTALAGVVGAMIAVGVAFLIEYLDDTIKTPEDVRAALGLETLGVIGAIGDPDRLVPVATDPRDPVSEAYRVLRTNIRYAAIDAPLRTLLVTSPGPTEGKSVTVANLAASMAEAGLKAVTVDADLRRPRQHRMFDLPRQPGLTDTLLSGRLDGELRPAMYMGDLQVLAAGELPPNPAEVLGSERMAALLQRLVEQADVVIVDSPPALPVTDAAVLARLVDAVLLVVDAGSTRRWAARQALEALSQVDANVIGAVLNNVPTRGIASRYYYYYYYREYYDEPDGRRVRRRSHRRRSVLGRLLGRRPAAQQGAPSAVPQAGQKPAQSVRDVEIHYGDR